MVDMRKACCNFSHDRVDADTPIRPPDFQDEDDQADLEG
jgi:hypothetical protein